MLRDVRAGRPLGDEEGGRDLLVTHALPEQPEDVLLALGQRLHRLGLVLAGPHALGEESGHGRVEMDLAGVGRPDRRSDLLGFGVLEEVARGTGLEGGGHLLLLDERGDGDDLRLG